MTRRAGARSRAIMGCIALGLMLAPGMASAADDVLNVLLDKAKILRMPPRAVTIVVGNPIIADVTTLKTDGLVVVTGKGFGETNMIFVDKDGNAIEETTVRVMAGNSELLVQRGAARESYSCRPRCQPTVALGDDDTFMKNTSAQITSRNQLAQPSSTSH